MNCSYVRENLSLYIDGALGEDKMIELESHLKACAACKREYDELREVTALLRGIADASIPESFDTALRAALKKEKIKKISDYKKRFRTFSGIAAVFVIGIFSVTMYNHMGSTSENLPEAGKEQISGSNAEFYGSASGTDGEDVRSAKITEEETAYDEYGLTSSALTMNDSTNALKDAGEPERHITTDTAVMPDKVMSGRDKIIVNHYLQLLEEELKNLRHEVVDYWSDANGVWNFKIEINTVNEFGEAIIETDIYVGQDGKLWIKESSSSMETAY